MYQDFRPVPGYDLVRADQRDSHQYPQARVPESFLFVVLTAMVVSVFW